MSIKMDEERKLIRQKLLSPELSELIELTIDLNEQKNAKVSESFRDSGNFLYRQKDHTTEIHEKMLNFYSMSIAFAPVASEELALGYADRSTLLSHLKKYQASIVDLDRALSITKSITLKIKLLCHKVDCLACLGSSESSSVFDKAVEYFNKIDERDTPNKEYWHNVLTRTKNNVELKKFLINNSNTVLPLQNGQQQITDLKSVDIKDSKKYGRQLIATRHIKPGEIFYAEKPLVVSPNGKKLYINCAHCLAIAWNGLPCKYCNWCIFCSAKCRKEAWMQYHYIECSVITHMIEVYRNSHNIQMSLRAMIMILTDCGGVEKLKAKIELMNISEDNYKQYLLSDNKCDQFCSALYLSNFITNQNCQIDIFNAAVALSYAAKYTTIFGKNLLQSDNCSTLADNEEVLFSGCLLSKFVQLCNKHAYSFPNSMKACTHVDETVRCLKNYCKNKSTYLTPFSGLISNSCIPNMRRCFTRDQKIVFYALEAISKNSPIYESYVCSFYETPKSIDRRDIISNNFKFACDCAACLNNWPSLLTSLKQEEGNEQITSSGSLSDARANFLESQLAIEYKELVKQATDKDTECDEKIILELRKAIERTSGLLAQPSNIRCTLLFAMKRAFDKIYGNSIKIFLC